MPNFTKYTFRQKFIFWNFLLFFLLLLLLLFFFSSSYLFPCFIFALRVPPRPLSPFIMIFTSSVLRPTLARSVRLNRLLSTLTIIEHTGGVLAPSNLNTLSAAKQLGGPITALVAGSQASKVASEVAKFDGVEKVLVANNEAYDRVSILAQNLPRVFFCISASAN